MDLNRDAFIAAVARARDELTTSIHRTSDPHERLVMQTTRMTLSVFAQVLFESTLKNTQEEHGNDDSNQAGD